MSIGIVVYCDCTEISYSVLTRKTRNIPAIFVGIYDEETFNSLKPVFDDIVKNNAVERYDDPDKIAFLEKLQTKTIKLKDSIVITKLEKLLQCLKLRYKKCMNCNQFKKTTLRSQCREIGHALCDDCEKDNDIIPTVLEKTIKYNNNNKVIKSQKMTCKYCIASHLRFPKHIMCDICCCPVRSFDGTTHTIHNPPPEIPPEYTKIKKFITQRLAQHVNEEPDDTQNKDEEPDEDEEE